MVPHAARNKPAEQFDFFSRRVLGPLPRIQTLRQDLKAILQLVTLYTKVVDRNGSVAKHLQRSLFSNKIEDRFNSLFSSPQPQIVDVAVNNDYCGTRPSWVDVIRESKKNDRITSHDEDKHIVPVRGALVEVSKSDWDILSSNVLQMLLETPPEPEDVQSELGARNELIKDLSELGEGISEIDGMIQAMLQTLQEKTSTVRRDATTLGSSTLPVGIQMCHDDEDGISHPEIDPDTIVDSGIDDDSRDRHASITPSSLETSMENNPKAPLKSFSAWSPLERGQLRNFLSTRGHLSWSRIALEYEAEYHRGRSAASIASQARYFGLAVGRESNKQSKCPVRRNLLILKVRVPPIDRFSFSEKATLAEPAQTKTGVCLGGETPIASCATSFSLQERPLPPVQSQTTSLCVGSDSLPALQSRANKNHISLRHSDPELPRSFGFMLN